MLITMDRSCVCVGKFLFPMQRSPTHTCALGVANIRVCFMNGSMIEHDGLGITLFSVGIFKDMVACWYA